MSDNNSFGKYLRELREAYGLSISGLHRLTGVSQPYLSQLENGTKKPSMSIIHKIASGLTDNVESNISFKVMYKELLKKAGYNTDWYFLDEVYKDAISKVDLTEQAIENYKNNIATPVYLNENNEGNFYFFKDSGPIPEKVQEKINKIIKTILD